MKEMTRKSSVLAMSYSPLNIQRINTRHDNVQEALASLREKLSPQGNIVSEAGRQRTVAVFGEPLTPQQVVELSLIHI